MAVTEETGYSLVLHKNPSNTIARSALELDDVWHIRIMQMCFVILSQLNEYDDDD